MSSATSSADVEVVTPLQLGAVNYVLIVVSTVIGVVLISGVLGLVYMEFKRFKDHKEEQFRRKLQVRRKGISGKSVIRGSSIESAEVTSYIQLSETPTSVRENGDENMISIHCSTRTSVSEDVSLR